MHHFVMQNPQVNGEGGGTKQVSVGGCRGWVAHTYSVQLTYIFLTLRVSYYLSWHTSRL